MLGPLQERLWRLVGRLPEAETAALAGGAAWSKPPPST